MVKILSWENLAEDQGDANTPSQAFQTKGKIHNECTEPLEGDNTCLTFREGFFHYIFR